MNERNPGIGETAAEGLTEIRLLDRPGEASGAPTYRLARTVDQMLIFVFTGELTKADGGLVPSQT